MNVSTVITGKATYDHVPHNSSNGLDYGATEMLPIRGAQVQAITPNNTTLANGVTDENGDFSLTVAGNASVRIRVRAALTGSGSASWDVRVVDNTAGGAVYVMDSITFATNGATMVQNMHALSGWGGSAYTGERAAGPFAILDAIYDALNKVLAVDPGAQFPLLLVNWSPANRPIDGNEAAGEIGTSFYRRMQGGDSEIYLLGAENNDTDEYDDHVVIHEWGHFLEDRFARSDSLGGSHSNGDRLDPRVAFSEGFGYAFAGMVTDDPNSRDSGGFNQLSGFNINVEDNANLNPGWYSEGSVQSVLYDFYDAAADGPDNLALGFAPIYAALTGPVADDPSMATIFSFLVHLKAARPGDATAINSIVAPQDIVSVAVDEYGSNESNDAGRSQDVLPVYTQLALDGTPTTLCSIGGDQAFGVYNKLSNRRLLRFTLQSGTRISFSAVGPTGSDPDMVLHQRGLIAISEAEGSSEFFQRDLPSGEYVLEVYEYSNVTETPRGRTCFDISASVF